MRVFTLFFLWITALNLISCKNDENTVSKEENTPSTTKSTSTSPLDKALAVLDEPQFDEESLLLRTLDLAALLPELNQSELKTVYEKLISCRELNQDALVLILQNLTRIDVEAAREVATSLRGLRELEMDFIRALVEFTALECDLEKLKTYIEVNAEKLEDADFGSFRGSDLVCTFWYRYHLQHPDLKIQYDVWDNKFAASVLAKIRLAQFTEVLDLGKLIGEQRDIQEEILTYAPFVDLEYSQKLVTTEEYSKFEKRDKLITFIQHPNSTEVDHLKNLSDQEKDLLILSNLIEGNALLHLDKLSSLNEESLKRLIYFSSHKGSCLSLYWEPVICSYYLSKTNALAAYQFVYDPSYTTSSYLATTPLLELIKHDSTLALLEYQKLSKWPLITPVGLASPTAKNWRFSFCYELASAAPELAISAGGKYLDYPGYTMGFATESPITGVAYALAKAGKEKALIHRITDSPRSWTENVANTNHWIDELLAGIYMYDLKLGEQYKEQLCHALGFENIDFEFPLTYLASRYSAPSQVMKFLETCDIPEGKQRKSLKQEYLKDLFYENPILATRLAAEHKITIPQSAY